MHVKRWMTTGAMTIALIAYATPARATEVAVGQRVVPTVSAEGEACYLLGDGPWAGVATATGVVQTGPLISVETHTSSSSSDDSVVVFDVRPFVTTLDDPKVCVGGVGAAVTGGMIVFGFDASNMSGDVVIVTKCVYGSSGRRCTS